MDVKGIITLIGDRLKTMARGNAVASQPVSVGNRHVLPLCELSLTFGGGGGTSEDTENDQNQNGQGTGGGVGGSARAVPVAVVVVDGDDIRIESFGK